MQLTLLFEVRVFMTFGSFWIRMDERPTPGVATLVAVPLAPAGALSRN